MRALVLVFLVACNQSPQNPALKPSDSSIVKLSLPLKSSEPRTAFKIASVLPQFGEEPGFRELESYSLGYHYRSLFSYSIYQLPKQKVQELLAKHPIATVDYENGGKLYAKLQKMENDSFLKKHVEPAEFQIASDFYNKALNKKVDIYSYYTGSHIHYLFFDSVSNLVFHRLMDTTW